MTGNDVARDFLLGGTALSPDLPLLLGQLVLTGCVLRGGRTGMVGVIGLTVLGAVYALGQLGEPIARQAFSVATFNAAQATLVTANLVFPTLMAVFGALEWRDRRRASRMLAMQADT